MNEREEQPGGEILVGFGQAVIRMDGEEIYNGEARARSLPTWERLLTFDHAARIAEECPESQVEVVIHGPFWGRTWEYREGAWVVTGADGGFA